MNNFPGHPSPAGTPAYGGPANFPGHPSPAGTPAYGGFALPANIDPAIAALAAQLTSADPDSTGKGQYPCPGIFRVTIARTFMRNARKSGNAFICNFHILESNNSQDPAGCGRDWFVDIGHNEEHRQMGLSNIKGFLLALCGIDYHMPGAKALIDAASGPMFAAILSAANPCSGKTMLLECSQIMTKRNTPFTIYHWMPDGAPFMPSELAALVHTQPAAVVPPVWPAAPQAPGYAQAPPVVGPPQPEVASRYSMDGGRTWIAR